jgi:hypothetical protein
MKVITKEQEQAFRDNFHRMLDGMLDKLFLVGEHETPSTEEQPAPEVADISGVEFPAVPDALWARMVKAIFLAGWSVEKLLNSNDCKNLEITKTEVEILRTFQLVRQEMVEGKKDLTFALGLRNVGNVEREIIKEFAEKNGIK